jgi:hypothetical protein
MVLCEDEGSFRSSKTKAAQSGLFYWGVTSGPLNVRFGSKADIEGRPADVRLHRTIAIRKARWRGDHGESRSEASSSNSLLTDSRAALAWSLTAASGQLLSRSLFLKCPSLLILRVHARTEKIAVGNDAIICRTAILIDVWTADSLLGLLHAAIALRPFANGRGISSNRCPTCASDAGNSSTRQLHNLVDRGRILRMIGKAKGRF